LSGEWLLTLCDLPPLAENIGISRQDGNFSQPWTVLFWTLNGRREDDNGDGRSAMKRYRAFDGR
jgi:hypothetical protein